MESPGESGTASVGDHGLEEEKKQEIREPGPAEMATTDTSSKDLQTASSSGSPEQQPPAPTPPPDGGLTAWLQVFGSFFLFFNSWGIVNTYGLFQEYYGQVLIPDKSPSAISWVGSFQGCALFLVTIIVGPLFDRGYLRTTILVGSFLVVFGMMMTSLSTQYYQIFLAQGLVVGCGLAFVVVPAVAIPSMYFSTRRALALGITISGGSIGSVLFPIMFRGTIHRLGFGWATRLMAFITLGTLPIPLILLRTRVPPRRKSLIDWTLFHEAPSLAMCGAMFLNFAGLYIPLFYLPTFFAVSLHQPGSMTFYILSIANGSSLVGRLVAGALADRIGAVNTGIPISLINTVMVFAWIGIHSVAGTVVFAVIYGFSSGAIISVGLTIVAQMAPSLNVVATRLGMISCFSGLGLLIGTPIAGALIDLEKNVFWKAQVFSGVLLAGCSALMCVVRITRGREVSGWKI